MLRHNNYWMHFDQETLYSLQILGYYITLVQYVCRARNRKGLTMLHYDPEDYKLSRFAEFKDRKIEEEYFSQYIFSSLSFFRRLVLIFCSIFLLLGVYDIIYYQFNIDRFGFSLMVRCLVFLFGLLFYVTAPKMKKAVSITNAISVLGLVLVLGYILLLYSQKEQGFLEQSMSIMLIIISLFMLPNRWISLLLTSGTIIVVFTILAPTYIYNLDPYIIAEVFILLVTAVIIASIFFIEITTTSVCTMLKTKCVPISRLWIN